MHEDKPTITDDDVREQILAAVTANPGTSWRKVLEQTSGNTRTRERIRDQLLESGLLINRGTGNRMSLFRPPDDRVHFGQLLRALRSLPRWVKIAGETAAAIGVILGLAFLLIPGWKPQDCRGDTRGEFTRIELERAVTRGGFLDLLHASKEGVPPERLKQPGKLVTFTLVTSNLTGKALTLRTWVLSEDGEPVPDPTLRNQLAVTITPTDCQERHQDRIWSPLPQRSGRYKILLDITLPDGSPVDSKASEAFSSIS